MFPCDKCGLCCMRVSRSSLYADLDRGDGVCRYFNDVNHLCTIYPVRPLRCNVDASYEVFYQDQMTREEFYRLNLKACNQLKAEAEGKKHVSGNVK